MTHFVKAVLLAEAFAVATYGLGWWSVPIVAAIYALASPSKRKALIAAACAAAGWATLLLLDIAKGPVIAFGSKLGQVMGMPAIALYLMTLLVPALLAWSAATIVPGLRPASR
jgi:hypothetical protein